MPFVILGLLITTIGILLFRWGAKSNSHEVKNGSLALILAGVFLLLWGIIILFTGNFAFNV
jgi:hypothetical protein